MIKHKCDKCKKELTDFGGLIFGPPYEEELTTVCEKNHLCIECYNVVENFIYRSDQFEQYQKWNNARLDECYIVTIDYILHPYKQGYNKLDHDTSICEVLEKFKTYNEAHDYCYSWTWPERQSLEIWDLSKNPPMNCYWD